MAFTNMNASTNVGGMNGMNIDINNPLIGFYADQAMQYAQRNPHDAQALQQAQYWAALLQQQRQAQGVQLQLQAAQHGLGPQQQPTVPARCAPHGNCSKRRLARRALPHTRTASYHHHLQYQ